MVVVVGGLAAVAVWKETEATHYYSGYRWQYTSVSWCFSTSLPTNWQSQYNSAAATWNASPSRWTLGRVSSCLNALAFAGRRSFSQQGWPRWPGITFVGITGNYVTSASTD